MHWAQIREVTFVPGIRLLVFTHRLLGRRAFRILLFPVVLWHMVMNSGARRASLEYLSRLHRASGGMTPAPNWRNTLRHFVAFAESLLDKLLVWNGGVGEIEYQVQGADIVTACLAGTRGVVMLNAHMGNPELCQVLANQHLHRRLNVLVHVEHAARFNSLLQRDRLPESVRLIPVAAFTPAVAAQLAECVDRGELVATSGDRVPLGSEAEVVQVDFLGAPAAFPIGPYALASLLQCPLIVVVATRRSTGYLVSARSLADSVCLPRGERRHAATSYARRYAEILEAECRAAPLQWFNFFPFWAR